MFFEAFGIFLLILLIVISWRVVDSIMQAPGTSASLPLVSTPPAIATTGTGPIVAGGVSQTNFTMPDMSSYYGSYFPAGTTSTTPTVVPAGTPLAASTTAPVPGATTTPSALPPLVITPPSPADLQASMGLSGLSMPAVDMSKYYPTSLARTPAPVSPAPLPAVVPPPVVSAPAPLVVAPAVAPAPLVVAPVVPAPAPQAVAPVVPAPAPQAVAPTTYTMSSTRLATILPSTQSTCPSGTIQDGSYCNPINLQRAKQVAPICPTGFTSFLEHGVGFCVDSKLNPSKTGVTCPAGIGLVLGPNGIQGCSSCPAGTTQLSNDSPPFCMA